MTLSLALTDELTSFEFSAVFRALQSCSKHTCPLSNLTKMWSTWEKNRRQRQKDSNHAVDIQRVTWTAFAIFAMFYICLWNFMPFYDFLLLVCEHCNFFSFSISWFLFKKKNFFKTLLCQEESNARRSVRRRWGRAGSHQGPSRGRRMLFSLLKHLFERTWKGSVFLLRNILSFWNLGGTYNIQNLPRITSRTLSR